MKTVVTPQTKERLLCFLREELESAGIGEAREEAERILEEVLGMTRTELYLDPDREIPTEAVERSFKILEGRKKRIPLAYLLGKAYFRNETLFVNENVLIPRPETEILVEAVIARTDFFRRTVPEASLSFLDIGTGSGAIAVSLLREFPDARGTLLDESAGALEVAKKNISNYGFMDRVKLIQGDLFAAFESHEKWDLIVSNPPYLSQEDLRNLQPELEYEPRVALDGGGDGLDFYRKIIPEAKRHLSPGGNLVFEIGAGQAGQVSKWLQEAGYVNIQRFKDLLGIERVIIANG